MIPSHPLESSSPHMLDFFFLFEFPLLLSGIWLAVTTAQTLNGLQSRHVFPPLLVCLFLPPNLWNMCVCVWSLCGTEMCVCLCECVCYWPGHRVNLQGKPHHTSTPRMSLSPWLHGPVLPLFLCPSCTACLSQSCTLACLKLSHSPGALSSVGGNTLNNYFHMIEWNVTLQTGAQVTFSSVLW